MPHLFMTRTHTIWMKYNLRALLLVVLVVGIGLSFISARLHRKRIERVAIAAINRHGGRNIRYDYGHSGPSLPHWARRLFGDDFFGEVVALNVNEEEGSIVDAADLEYVRFLTELRLVDLDHFQFNDVEAEPLRYLKKLEFLSLISLKLTDAGVQHLSDMKRLRSLRLCGNGISDEGLRVISQLTSLEELDLVRFHRVGLKPGQITDDGFHHLEALNKLRKLRLIGMGVSDKGVRRLKRLITLRELCLDGTDVTDASVDDFAALRNLEVLSVQQTAITEYGLEQIQRILPNCAILPVWSKNRAP